MRPLLLEVPKKLIISSSSLWVRGMAKVNIPQVPEEPLHPTGRAAAAQPTFGKIYDKKPFKFRCEKGKTYLWCACGQGHSQPFCDKLCLNTHFKISMRPVKFICPETKDYWFCNCKQTKNRPFCDGSHRGEDVIAAVRV